MSSIAVFGLRGSQILFSIVVLGISVNLVKDQKYGAAPTALTFSSFVGAFGILTGLIGIAAVFVDKLNGFIIMVVDAIAGIFFLIGGVVIVTKLKGVNCTESSFFKNYFWDDKELLNGGVVDAKKEQDRRHGYNVRDDLPHMQSRCKQAEATAAFEFMSVIVVIAAIAVTFLFIRKRN